MHRAGWILTGFVGAFLLVDGGARLARFAPYVEGAARFGYDASLAPWIGLALLLSTIVMLIPRTAVLGCILVTGYLGGAVAAQVRVQHDAWFLFPVALGAAAWLGLYLRDARLRALIPLR
jgi:DoxX-like protein